MADPKPKRWPKIVGYPIFFLVSLIAGFFITFPYDALRLRARLEAEKAGYSVRFGGLGPGLFALRATDVELRKKVEGDAPAEPLKLDRVTVGPTLFPPGVGVAVKALGGATTVRVSGFTAVRAKIDAEDLDLTKGNVKGFTGVDLQGTLEAHVDLSIPLAAVGGGPKEPDLGQANGTISLETKGLTINGGTMNVALPQFGPEPTPMDLPKIVLGDIDGKLKFDKGQGTVDELKSRSPDIEIAVTGGIKLAKRVDYSEPNLEVRFKPDPEFQKRLGLVGSALSMVGPDPKDPAWRMGRLTGFLGKPRFP